MSNRFKETDYFIENKDYSTEVIDPDNITVLNWNIQKKNHHDLWNHELKNIVEENNPSIILFQECQFEKGLEKLLHTEHFGFIFAPNFIDIFKNRHSGVLTASHAIHNNVSVIKSYAFEPLIKVPKIFLSTTYKLLGTSLNLLVLNIHAINFVGFWKFISQVQQIEYSIKSHNGPVILSGDFNTWNKKRSKILDKIVVQSGMKKVEFDKDHEKNIKKFLFNNTLDHIYYKDIQLTGNCKTLKTRSSDHNPLLVNFKLISSIQV